MDAAGSNRHIAEGVIGDEAVAPGLVGVEDGTGEKRNRWRSVRGREGTGEYLLLFADSPIPSPSPIHLHPFQVDESCEMVEELMERRRGLSGLISIDFDRCHAILAHQVRG